MQLTPDIIQKSKNFRTPALLIDLDQLKSNYQSIKQALPSVHIFYAMKANDHIRILESLHDLGSSFEISSLHELRELRNINVPSEKIMCFNSIKNPEFLTEMTKQNIRIMAFDSTDEIDKIAKYAPQAQVVLRVMVDNQGSDWPLTKKFGVEVNEALPLLLYAKSKGLEAYGLTFHVGSQCLHPQNWDSALKVCKEIYNQAKQHDITLQLISLGGGIPTQHIKPIPTITEIGTIINQAINTHFTSEAHQMTFTIEPGRGMVGNTGILVTNVVGKAKRQHEDWLFTDVGVFNGLMETIENFQYEIKTEHEGSLKTVTIAGPSCDSVDIPFKNVQLPEVAVGENIFIINAGAYTTVYAAEFNGFDTPYTYFYQDMNTPTDHNTVAPWEEWIPKNYLRDYYSEIEPDELATIKFLVESCKNIKGNPKMIEFGCGPTMHHIFAATPYVSEIHMADYLDSNLEEIRKWVHNDSDAHDWTEFIKYTLQCEGNSNPTTADIQTRASETRTKITEIFQVDAGQKNPLTERPFIQYPVVMSCYCADSATDDKATWELYMRNIAALVQPDGFFITTALMKAATYKIGEKYFPSADVDENSLRTVMELDFYPSSITIEVRAMPEHEPKGYLGILLAQATKK